MTILDTWLLRTWICSTTSPTRSCEKRLTLCIKEVGMMACGPPCSCPELDRYSWETLSTPRVWHSSTSSRVTFKNKGDKPIPCDVQLEELDGRSTYSHIRPLSAEVSSVVMVMVLMMWSSPAQQTHCCGAPKQGTPLRNDRCVTEFSIKCSSYAEIGAQYSLCLLFLVLNFLNWFQCFFLDFLSFFQLFNSLHVFVPLFYVFLPLLTFPDFDEVMFSPGQDEKFSVTPWFLQLWSWKSVMYKY